MQKKICANLKLKSRGPASTHPAKQPGLQPPSLLTAMRYEIFPRQQAGRLRVIPAGPGSKTKNNNSPPDTCPYFMIFLNFYPWNSC